MLVMQQATFYWLLVTISHTGCSDENHPHSRLCRPEVIRVLVHGGWHGSSNPFPGAHHPALHITYCFMLLCFSLAFAVPVCLAIFPQQRYVHRLRDISFQDHKSVSSPPPSPPFLPLLLFSSSMSTSSLEPGVREAILSTRPDIKTVYFNKGL